MFALPSYRIFFALMLGFSVCLGGLVGCAGDSRIFKEAVGLVWGQGERGGQDLTLAQTLSPSLRYLRVTVAGRSVLLVMGYIESDATEVWYSGQGEVLKLKHGRIVATTGFPVEWLAMRYDGLPAWAVNVPLNEPKNYQRVLDLKAGYRLGVTEQVRLESIAKPDRHQLQGSVKSSANVLWFKESYQPADLPDSIFAIGSDGYSQQVSRVIYSWQCLSKSYCLQLQPWSLDDHAALLAQSKEKLKE